jgi:putative endonuclease
MPTTLATGHAAEAYACEHLQGQGLKLVSQNFRCARGEIDLIMHDKDTTVFVEVRYRRSTRFGSGADSVDYHKQRKLLATAAFYLQQHPKAAKSPCRFDVVSLSLQDDKPRLEWIRDAFQA